MNGIDGFMTILKLVYGVVKVIAKILETILENQPAQKTLYNKINGKNGEKINGVHGEEAE